MRRGSGGFTLLELLVAIAIFATLSLMAYGGLASVLESREQTEQAADRLTALQRLFTLLQRDLEQTAPRPVRDNYGDRRAPLLSPNDGSYLLELTHGGRGNPAQLPRSSLQRVAYRLHDGTLARLQWPNLDRAQDAAPDEVSLFDGVRHLSLRLLDDERQWHQSWPPLAEGDVGALPRAVELTLELDDYGTLSRLFRVGG